MKKLWLSSMFLYFVGMYATTSFYEGCQGVQTLEEFLIETVSRNEWTEFKEFYHLINAKHQKKRLDVRQRARAKLQQHALNALEVKKPEWAMTIKKDKESKAAQLFLTRYGILQEYYQDQAQKTGNIRSKFVSFGKTIADKASKTVSFFKRTEKI